MLMKTIISIMFIMMILLMMLITPKILALISEPFSNKWSTFECGFSNNSQQRNVFSTQFFMIMILFLIFDIEISLLFPIPIQFTQKNHQMNTILFLILLLIGLTYEWKTKKLNWSS